MFYIYCAMPSRRRNQERLHPNQDLTPHGTAVNKTDKNREKCSKECKDVRQAHGSFASQSNPTGIVDFELRHSVDGDVVASGEPEVVSLEVARNAIHGGVGEPEASGIPDSGGCCDGG